MNAETTADTWTWMQPMGVWFYGLNTPEEDDEYLVEYDETTGAYTVLAGPIELGDTAGLRAMDALYRSNPNAETVSSTAFKSLQRGGYVASVTLA